MPFVVASLSTRSVIDAVLPLIVLKQVPTVIPAPQTTVSRPLRLQTRSKPDLPKITSTGPCKVGSVYSDRHDQVIAQA